jgi:hypothetical protein
MQVHVHELHFLYAGDGFGGYTGGYCNYRESFFRVYFSDIYAIQMTLMQTLS